MCSHFTLLSSHHHHHHHHRRHYHPGGSAEPMAELRGRGEGVAGDGGGARRVEGVARTRRRSSPDRECEEIRVKKNDFNSFNLL